MTVVFPAAIASRTSIHVISSSQTVFGGGNGFRASTQLYAFAVQSPPPRLRLGAWAESCAAEKYSTANASMVFIDSSQQKVERLQVPTLSARRDSPQSTP